ncbi:MAG TPA: endolytic transglycosylase MltG [Gemmatimonadales bacterium]|nr:endolytic transglycosylase MltG [Gemmatimonadales bacterium]
MRPLRLLLATAAAAAGAACATPPPTGRPVRVEIPAGASLKAIADTLHKYQVIDVPRFFRIYTKLSGHERDIQAGIYDLHRHRPVGEVLEALTTGGGAYHRLAMPEGLMLHELAGLVERRLGIPAESLLAATRDSGLIARVAPGAPSLDGYLYPSTHFVPLRATARDVVRQLVAEFEARWKPEWNGRLAALQLTRHQTVILASIIEGEVRQERDRPYVSSVYHNRLRAGWRLQADPTVIYALGRRRRLYEKDYLLRSPYNTYLIDGLPPGPINQPSAASLEAALYPADTRFFFMVAGADGQHIFSRTLREHLAAVRRVRQQR